MPFALRWLQADLPARLGRAPEAVDALYRLLEHCNARLAACDVNGETDYFTSRHSSLLHTLRCFRAIWGVNG